MYDFQGSPWRSKGHGLLCGLMTKECGNIDQVTVITLPANSHLLYTNIFGVISFCNSQVNKLWFLWAQKLMLDFNTNIRICQKWASKSEFCSGFGDSESFWMWKWNTKAHGSWWKFHYKSELVNFERVLIWFWQLSGHHLVINQDIDLEVSLDITLDMMIGSFHVNSTNFWKISRMWPPQIFLKKFSNQGILVWRNCAKF